MRALLSVSIGVLFASGCAGYEPGEASGSAPEISSLAVSPETLPVGEATRVDGTLAFADPDGDVELLGIGLSLEGSADPEVQEVEVAGAASLTAGLVPFMLMVAPPASGQVDLELWLVDGAGHRSNVLGATLTAE